MGISIKEAIENNVISQQTAHLLPKMCKCGAPLEFSESLKEIRCTNENCKYSIIYRVREFCRILHIGFTDSDIEEIVNVFGIITPYQIIQICDDEIIKSPKFNQLTIHDISDKIQNIKNITQSEYFLYKVVELVCLDNISKVAHKLFKGFETIDEAYFEIENGQLSFINERLGIKDQDSSIISLEIFNELLSIKDELIFAESLFSIKHNSKKRLNIAFADNIIPFINIGELIEYLNYTYNYNFVHVGTVSQTTDVVIRNAASSGTKLRTANVLNSKYVANKMNTNEIKLGDIGKIVDEQLKPIGSLVYIETLETLMNRLSVLENK